MVLKNTYRLKKIEVDKVIFLIYLGRNFQKCHISEETMKTKLCVCVCQKRISCALVYYCLP